MALTNCSYALQCSHCFRSWRGLDLWHMTFPQMMREAYAKGWITCYKSRNDGGDGEEKAYCPNCADRYKDYRFKYCVDK